MARALTAMRPSPDSRSTMSPDSSHPSRRDFLARSSALLAAGLLPFGVPAARAPRAKTLLILGGTGFIGPHLVRMAVARGHQVSIFTRGRRDAALPDGVERLVGDRNGQLDALRGRRWDAVIDDSATNPEWVRQSTELLASSGRYLFTSSTGVYYPYERLGLSERDPVHTDAADPKDPSEDYGTKKAQCEALVTGRFGDRGTVVRPTYIVGPGDYTDRVTYWPVRLTRGGDILAPGHPDDRVQFIDVRDLAGFMLSLVEGGRGGIYNAIGPRVPMTIAAFLAEAMRVIGGGGTLTWVEDYDLLLRHEVDGVVPWILTRGKDLGHTSITSVRSWDAGLMLRPVAETLRDTLAWFQGLPAERQAAAKWVLTAEKEAAILAEWRKRGD